MKKKQSDLQRMFEVLEAIAHEDLNNTQYSTLSIGPNEQLSIKTYFGSEEKDYKMFQSNSLYVFIWLDDTMEKDNFPKPDFTVESYEELCGTPCLTVIMCYQFENK